MTKSTSIIFILMFALVFGLEQWVSSTVSQKMLNLFDSQSSFKLSTITPTLPRSRF